MAAADTAPPVRPSSSVDAAALPMANTAPPLARDPLPVTSSSPLLAVIALPPAIAPLATRVPVPSMVVFALVAMAPATVSVLADANAIVVVLPPVAPASVRLLIATVVSSVTVNAASCAAVPMTTSLPVAGGPAGLQSGPVLQAPVVVPDQVNVAIPAVYPHPHHALPGGFVRLQGGPVSVLTSALLSECTESRKMATIFWTII